MARKRPTTEIDLERAALQVELDELDAIEDLTDDQLARFEAIPTEFEELEIERADSAAFEARIELVRSASVNPANVDAPRVIGRSATRGGGAPMVKRSGSVTDDPFELLRGSTGHMGAQELTRALIDANLSAIEGMDMPRGYTDSFPRMLKRHARDTSWAMNLLARQNPDYLSAWEKAVTGREILMSEVERAAIAVGTNTAGGFLVPTHLDPTLILTNSGAKDVLRGMSRVVTLTGGANVWKGVTTAGSTASWDGELTEVSDDTPAVASVSVPVFSAKSLIQASIESFEDITGLAQDVQTLLADSKVRLEAAAHMTGNGTTAPCGIFTALDANTNVEVQLTTGSTFTRADLAGIATALGDRWTDDAEWLMHPQHLERIAALGTALGANYSTDMTQLPTDQLLGYPVKKSFTAPSTFQTTTVDNLAVFGDFSNFIIVDKPGSTSVEFIPHLFNTSNNLPDGRRAWYMHFRNGSDSVNDLAFRLLQDKTTA